MAYVVELTASATGERARVPRADRGPDEIRVRTLYSGISAGTELTQYRGTNPYLDKQWDTDRAVFLPGAPTLRYPLDIWGLLGGRRR